MISLCMVVVLKSTTGICILGEKELTLNGTKCQFRLSKLTFYGHDLSSQRVAPSEKKVAALMNASPTQDASEVRSFVHQIIRSAGTVFCKIFPNFVKEALRSFLRKNEPFVWGEAQERSFQKLKSLLDGTVHLHISEGTAIHESLPMQAHTVWVRC